MTSPDGSREPYPASPGNRPRSSTTRTAGVTVPLFSIRSQRDFGIGEIGDLPKFAQWIRGAGLRVVQLLPSFELARGENSPYGARTAFGLDPIYVSLTDVPELDDTARAAALGDEGRAELATLRALPAVDYTRVRALKERVLDAAFAIFKERELEKDTPRAQAFRSFVSRTNDWESDLALYVALRDEHDQHGWSTWPDAEKFREPATLDAARARLGDAVLSHQYRQFLANEQWAAARRRLAELGVELMGDLPFIVGSESADVWAHRDDFRTDVSLGAPPDAYSADGQDWGLPAYDFQRMQGGDHFAWLKSRTKRASELYDRFRIDHVVGYFRQWVKPQGAPRGHFDVPSEEMQQERGHALLAALEKVAGDGAIIAEDLGVIPPWVRTTLTELGIPGYKILPWERDQREQIIYRDPKHFAELSVASWSTHDTAPINLWWKEMTDEERGGLAYVMGISPNAGAFELFEATMRHLFHSASGLALVLVQELVGDDVRINTPGTVGPENWSYRMGVEVEALGSNADIAKRMDRVRGLIEEAHR